MVVSMKALLIIVMLAVSLFAFGCVSQNGTSNNQSIVGNDSDAHGCKASAGYTWCAEKGKCLRVWEENCTPACLWLQAGKDMPEEGVVGAALWRRAERIAPEPVG